LIFLRDMVSLIMLSSRQSH